MSNTAKWRRAASALVTTFCLAFVFACSGNPAARPGGGGGGAVNLRGAGASFPNPLYQKWLSEYGQAHPDIRIDYQSIGSGGRLPPIREPPLRLRPPPPLPVPDLQRRRHARAAGVPHGVPHGLPPRQVGMEREGRRRRRVVARDRHLHGRAV